jgi:hypothetical protein
VQVFQLRPDLIEVCAAWCGGTVLPAVNGGPVLLVPGRDRAARRMAGLGDYVARTGQTFTAEPADGIAQRYQPAQEAAG